MNAKRAAHWVWILVGLSGAMTIPAAEEGTKNDSIFDLPYLMRDLPNGLRVIIVRTDYPDIVTIQIPVQAGSRNEVEPGKTGFAHFFEHMMFRGTELYPPDRYGEILKNAGADQNAYTTDDYTNYHITCTRADLEKVLMLEADRFMNLKYSEAQFRTEALAVKGEYLKNYSDPMRKIFEVMRNTAFQRHSYKHTTMGFVEDIERMPEQMEYAKLFFLRWYRPEKTAIILVGDLDPDSSFRWVEKYWSDWQRGDYALETTDEPAPSGPLHEHVVWETPTQPLWTVSFHGPAFDPGDKAMPAMQLVGELFFGDTSDLYNKLVIEQQAVDTLFYYFPLRKDPHLLTVGARLNNIERSEDVAREIRDALARARTEKTSPERLQAVKDHLRYAFASQLDNSEAIGATLASFVHFDRTPETLNQFYETLRDVQPAELLQYANTFFTDERQVIVTVAAEAEMPGASTLGLNEAVHARTAATTQSGHEPAIVELPAASGLIDVAYLFRAGAALDPAGKKGLAALTAAMVADAGSRGRTIRELDDAYYPMAAGFDAQVDKEMMRFSGTVHRDNWEAWHSLAKEQLLRPGWRDDDFKRLKMQQINSIRTDLRSNNDEELGKEALYQFIFGRQHPYGWYNLGAVDDVESITIEDVQEFYRRHLVPEQLTIGVAGGYPRELGADLTALARQMAGGERTELELPPPAPISGREALIIEKKAPAVAVSFGFPIKVRRGDPDWVGLWLLRSWLGEHRSSNSRLFQRIREARGMNYGNYAYIEYFPRGMFQFHPDPNLGRQQQIFQVWLRPLRNNNDALFATRTALFEMDKLVREGLTQEQFEATRNYLDKFVSLLIKGQSRQLGYLLDSRYYGTGPFTEYVRAELAKLSVARMNEIARKHLQTENVKFVFVAEQAGELRSQLISGAASPIEYNSPKPEELIAEDQIIEKLPLKFGAESVRIVPVEEVFKSSK